MSVYTLAVLASPVKFAHDYPAHALVARDFLKSRPPIPGLRFHYAAIFVDSHRHFVSGVEIHLNSPDWFFTIEIERGDDGLTASVQTDRKREAWER